MPTRKAGESFAAAGFFATSRASDARVTRLGMPPDEALEPWLCSAQDKYCSAEIVYLVDATRLDREISWAVRLRPACRVDEINATARDSPVAEPHRLQNAFLLTTVNRYACPRQRREQNMVTPRRVRRDNAQRRLQTKERPDRSPAVRCTLNEAGRAEPGLAICKGVVEAHGGRLRSKARPGQEVRSFLRFQLPRFMNRA